MKYDIFVIRHIIFFLLEIKSTFVHINNFYGKNKILNKIILRFFLPYLYYLKSKIFKNKLKFTSNEQNNNIIKYGYLELPRINIDKINFLEINSINSEKKISHNIIKDFSLAEKFAIENNFHNLAFNYFQEEFANFDIISWNTKQFENYKDLGTTQYHNDRDGFKILKFFIYLSDVDLNSGPHKFAISSHRIKYSRFLPQFRYADEEVEKYYKDIKIFTGEKGYPNLAQKLIENNFQDNFFKVIKDMQSH